MGGGDRAVRRSRLFADEVYDRLASGFEVINRHGETFHLPPTELVRMPSAVGMALAAPPDYGPAIWDPAPACNYHAASTIKDSIVIHMAEGTAAGVRASYKLCTSAASAHYVVSEVGTVWQMVRESHVAWHAECYNSTSIGVVHEGFSASASHPAALYKGSALLCRHLANAWQIPVEHRKDGTPGILGHSDAAFICDSAPVDDPGRGWNWTYFLDRIVGTTAGPGVVAAVSRREHLGAGSFDLSVAGDPSVESRAGGPTRLLVMFDEPITYTGEPDTSAVVLSGGRVEDLNVVGNGLSVQIGQVPEGQRLKVSFPGISGTDGRPVRDSVCFGVLMGDVTGDGMVDGRDLEAVREAMNAGPAALDLRFDVDLNGRLNAFDLTKVRARSGRVVPANCP